MSVEIPAASAHYVSAHPEQASSFEERWAAWQARGAAQDRRAPKDGDRGADPACHCGRPPRAVRALTRRMHSFTRVCREGSTLWCSVRLA
jgi:hypothetical protein